MWNKSFCKEKFLSDVNKKLSAGMRLNEIQNGSLKSFFS